MNSKIIVIELITKNFFAENFEENPFSLSNIHITKVSSLKLLKIYFCFAKACSFTEVTMIIILDTKTTGIHTII